MKLSLVTETFAPEVNGVAMTLGRLVSGLRERGWEVEVIRPCQETETPGEGLGELRVRGFPLPFYRSLRMGWPEVRCLRARWKKARPDRVHLATEGPLGWAALRVARSLGLVVTSSFHTNFHHYGGHYGLSLIRPLGLWYLRWFHNRTALTLAPTAELCDELAAQGFARLGVMSRGVDATLFHPGKRRDDLRRRWGVAEGAPAVLYVGRLAAEKNLLTAVAAFVALRNHVPSARFILVGDGPEATRLRQEYPEFEYAGARRGEDLAAHYASADLFLFPSLTETFGNVVTEAMASGLAVVAFDYAAARAHLRPSGAGWTAPVGRTEDFVAAALAAWAARAEWTERRQRAREAAESLAWSRVVERLAEDLQRAG